MSDEVTEIKQDVGVSPRALSLARAVDRLPSGTYNLVIQIPEVRAAPWELEVIRTEHIYKKVLSKYVAE